MDRAERIRLWNQAFNTDTAPEDPLNHREVIATWIAERKIAVDPDDPALPADPATKKDLAAIYGVSARTIANWIAEDEVPAPALSGLALTKGSGKAPEVFALHELLKAVHPPQRARMDPTKFGPEEQLTLSRIAQRAGIDGRLVYTEAKKGHLPAPDGRLYPARVTAEAFNNRPLWVRGRRSRTIRQ